MPKRSKQKETLDPATKNFVDGLNIVNSHPMFAPLCARARYLREKGNLCPADGWIMIAENGLMHVHPTRRGDPQEWAYVFAHALLHLGFDHFRKEHYSTEWNAACDLFIGHFLSDLKLGRPPLEVVVPLTARAADEEKIHQRFVADGVAREFESMGTAGANASDMLWLPPERRVGKDQRAEWTRAFAAGLTDSVSRAVDVAAGASKSLTSETRRWTPAEAARRWFVNSYPLLGSLAAGFKLVEDASVCQSFAISVAAVDAEEKEIYVNPAAALDEHEARFVLAHELLHVGLRHQERRRGRDPQIWNAACDYVINGWLLEMGVGELPKFGALYDPQLKGMSADAVYDLIVTDLRRARKLATFAGAGCSDMLGKRGDDWWKTEAGIPLDDYYRRCLSQGLTYHDEQGRGVLPAGLVQEIQALAQPPIEWDIELARWFDEHFPPIETVRSYARPSRRQSSTPDIPRPSVVPASDALDGRTFGVVVDTSGSMNAKLLGKALGAIASYSMSREVPLVRVVFCDAVAYDEGYLSPDAIAGRVRVRGRGGTVLQPGVDLLQRAEDFPPDGPILIITDGWCDHVRVRREHAFLIPEGRHLPFVAKGPVFYLT